MNYPKIINNTALIALIVVGAFAGFMIGLKLPAVFASLYPPNTSSLAAVTPALPENGSTVSPIVDEPIVDVPIAPVTAPALDEKIAGPKTETLQLINPPEPVNDIGKPDLAVKVLETGSVDKATNVFTATTSLRSTDRIAVRFSVENLGTKETGSWYFNAVLPTYPSHIYSSNSQMSLKPGERIEFTLGFDSVEKKDGNAVIINADPANSVFEASEENNIARVTIDGVSF